MATTTYAFSSQSGEWFSGFPHGVVHPNTDRRDAVKEVVTAAVYEARKHLKADMQADPRWEPYVGKVTFKWDGDGFVYGFEGTPEEVAAMKLIDQGDGQDVQASHLISRQLFRLQGRLDAVLGKTLQAALHIG
jgi:hypothetical protein